MVTRARHGTSENDVFSDLNSGVIVLIENAELLLNPQFMPATSDEAMGLYFFKYKQ